MMLKNDLDFVCMIDMHAHLLCLSEEYRGRLAEQEMYALAAQELAARREYGVDTVFSCGTPQEWEFMRRCLESGEGNEQPEKWNGGVFSGRYAPEDFRTADRDRMNDSGASEKQSAKRNGKFTLSFGIHPWYSDRFDPRDYRGLFMACSIIGEIGMDSVWCNIPLDIQRRVLAQQLEIAAELGKPIVLHTKGQEQQIAEMIRDFPGKVCVHWYSGGEAEFEKFLEAGCYFTLGPDLAECCALAEGKEIRGGNPGMTQSEYEALTRSAVLYERMLREIPTERMFLETDGLSSIAWMRGQETGAVSFRDIPAVLEKNLKFAAKEKRVQSGQLSACLKENFHEFVS